MRLPNVEWLRLYSAATGQGWRSLRCYARFEGFSLLEMAVVLLLLGLLLGGGLSLASGQVATQRLQQTALSLQDAITALRGFAAYSGGRLPCPDSEPPFDGVEDVDTASGMCRSTASEGWFPHVSLGGVGRADSWGRRLRYRVVADAARAHATGFPVPGLRVCRVLDAARLCQGLEASGVLAVVLSHGANGHGGLDPLGHGLPLISAGRDELANADGDELFVSHEARTAAGHGGEFDDMVDWLPNSSYQAVMLDR